MLEDLYEVAIDHPSQRLRPGQKAHWRGTVVTVTEEICQQAGPGGAIWWSLSVGWEVRYDLGFDLLQIQQLRAVNLCLSPHPDCTALYDKADYCTSMGKASNQQDFMG